MENVPDNPRWTRPPVSLRDLGNIAMLAKAAVNVSMADGSTTGGAMEAGPSGIGLGAPTDLRGFYAIITANNGDGTYQANQIDDAGVIPSNTYPLAPQYQWWEGLADNILIGEVNNNPNVPIDTIVFAYPATNNDIPWGFNNPGLIAPPAGGGGGSPTGPPTTATPPGTIVLQPNPTNPGSSTVYISLGGGVYLVLCSCGTYTIGGGGGSVTTACCSINLPATLYASIAVVTGTCACLNDLSSIPLTWNGLAGSSAQWIGQSIACLDGFPITIIFYCIGIGQFGITLLCQVSDTAAVSFAASSQTDYDCTNSSGDLALLVNFGTDVPGKDGPCCGDCTLSIIVSS